MTGRILVVPANLESGGSQLRRSAAALRALVSNVNKQFLYLDWEGGDRELMQARITAANKQAETLVAEAETLANYLLQQADRYANLDSTCSRGLSGLTDTTVAALAAARAGAAIMGVAAANAAAAALATAVGGAAAFAATTSIPDYDKTMNPESEAPRQSNLVAPRPPAPPAPTETGLPTTEQLRYMQWVFGIDEDGYGPETKAAVEHLQRRRGIAPDDQMMIGPNTWEWLERFAKYRVNPVGEPSVELTSPLGVVGDQRVALTSHWGDHPEGYIEGWSHWGLDLAVDPRDDKNPPPVLSATGGTVLYAGLDPRTPAPEERVGFGNVVVVQADDGTILVYAHMNGQPSVKPGDQINTASPLGTMGSTGASTGPHLHLEVWRGISGEFTKGGHADWEAALRSTKPETFGNKNPLNYFDEAIRAGWKDHS